MPLYKLIVLSDRTPEGQEVIRLNRRSTLSWTELINKLNEIYDIQSADYVITWFDGVDQCSIHDTSDMMEADRYYRDSPSPDGAIRLTVTMVPDARNNVSASNISNLQCHVAPPRVIKNRFPSSSSSSAITKRRYRCSLTPVESNIPSLPRQASTVCDEQRTRSFEMPSQVSNELTSRVSAVEPDEREERESFNRIMSLPASVTQSQPSTSSTTLITLAQTFDCQPSYVKPRLQALRRMGFRQNDCFLINVIRKCYGDLNRVIETLDCS